MVVFTRCTQYVGQYMQLDAYMVGLCVYIFNVCGQWGTLYSIYALGQWDSVSSIVVYARRAWKYCVYDVFIQTQM